MTVKRDYQFILKLTSRDKDILRGIADYHETSMSEMLRLLLRREAKAVGVTIRKPRRVIRGLR